MSIRFRLNLDSVIVVTDDAIETVPRSAANFESLVDALQSNKDLDEIERCLTVEGSLENWSHGKFKMDDGSLTIDGEGVPDQVVTRITQALKQGDSPAAMLRFMERLKRNPDPHSRDQLLSFLEHKGIPIRPDGKFLAYKGVKKDFRDSYSGAIDNSPGQTVMMDRELISSDSGSACGRGLHVGALAYARSFAPVVVVCEVDPEHVVSVPDDHMHQKMRVCEYRVVGVHGGELLPSTTFDVQDAITAQVDGSAGEPAILTNGVTADGDAAPAKEGSGVVLPLTGTDWDDLNDMDSLELMKLRIMRLRSYARYNCLMIGASKMRGGKIVLVPAICKARGYADPAEQSKG